VYGSNSAPNVFTSDCRPMPGQNPRAGLGLGLREPHNGTGHTSKSTVADKKNEDKPVQNKSEVTAKEMGLRLLLVAITIPADIVCYNAFMAAPPRLRTQLLTFCLIMILIVHVCVLLVLIFPCCGRSEHKSPDARHGPVANGEVLELPSSGLAHMYRKRWVFACFSLPLPSLICTYILGYPNFAGTTDDGVRILPADRFGGYDILGVLNNTYPDIVVDSETWLVQWYEISNVTGTQMLVNTTIRCRLCYDWHSVEYYLLGVLQNEKEAALGEVSLPKMAFCDPATDELLGDLMTNMGLDAFISIDAERWTEAFEFCLRTFGLIIGFLADKAEGTMGYDFALDLTDVFDFYLMVVYIDVNQLQAGEHPLSKKVTISEISYVRMAGWCVTAAYLSLVVRFALSAVGKKVGSPDHKVEQFRRLLSLAVLEVPFAVFRIAAWYYSVSVSLMLLKNVVSIFSDAQDICYSEAEHDGDEERRYEIIHEEVAMQMPQGLRETILLEHEQISGGENGTAIMGAEVDAESGQLRVQNKLGREACHLGGLSLLLWTKQR